MPLKRHIYSPTDDLEGSTGAHEEIKLLVPTNRSVRHTLAFRAGYARIAIKHCEIKSHKPGWLELKAELDRASLKISCRKDAELGGCFRPVYRGRSRHLQGRNLSPKIHIIDWVSQRGEAIELGIQISHGFGHSRPHATELRIT